ncbi:Uncharacterised protein [Escherichia coli]|nr:Uncharacterised protein [Escherichia coli]
MLSLRFQDPDTADVARIAPDQKGRPAFTPRNPRLERIGVVVDVVDDKAGAGQRAPGGSAENRPRNEVARVDDGRYADTRHGSAQRAAGGWSRPLCTEPW